LRERERVVEKDRKDRKHLVGEVPLRRKKKVKFGVKVFFL
jgi:hypothetical protein